MNINCLTGYFCICICTSLDHNCLLPHHQFQRFRAKLTQILKQCPIHNIILKNSYLPEQTQNVVLDNRIIRWRWCDVHVWCFLFCQSAFVVVFETVVRMPRHFTIWTESQTLFSKPWWNVICRSHDRWQHHNMFCMDSVSSRGGHSVLKTV